MGKRIRAWMIRWSIVVLVVVVGGTVVCGIELMLRSQASVPAESSADCDTGEYPSSTVTVRAAVEVNGVDYPQISSKIEIHVPRLWRYSSDLLGSKDHSAYRNALRCLLGNYDTDFSVYRSGPPTVTVTNGDVMVQDYVWAELTKPGHGAVGVLDLTVEPDQPWRLTVVSRGGLSHSTSWRVTVAAPPRWLDSAVPSPWPPLTAQPGELTWYYGSTAPAVDEYTLASVELAPDVRAAAFVWEGAPTGDLFVTVVNTLGTAAFLAVILIFVRRLRKTVPPEAEGLTKLGQLVERMTLPLLGLLFVSLGIEITWASLTESAIRSEDWSAAAWAVDIAVCVAILAIVWRFGLRLTSVLAAAVVLAAILVSGWLLRNTVAFTNTEWPRSMILRLCESGMIFVVALVAVAAVITAVRSLIWRDNAERQEGDILLAGMPEPVWWVWPVASIVSAGLLLERYWTAAQTYAAQQWMYGPGPATETLKTIFRYTLWRMPADWLWILDAIPAIGVYALARAYLTRTKQVMRPELMMITVVLLVVGPAQWSLTVDGFAVPVWLIVATVFWLLCRAGTPVLSRKLQSGEVIRRHLADDVAIADAERAATWWFRHATSTSGPRQHPALPKRITPLDVVLALGPGQTPRENMKLAVKFILWPGIVGGLAVYAVRTIARADLTGVLPDSVALGYVSDVVWIVLKWIFAAAVLGVFWQHLPGKRGPVKVLPLVAAYSVGSVCLFVAPTLVGGDSGTDNLIDAAVFTVVLMFVGLAMDISTLNNLDAVRHLTLREAVTVYGLGNLPSQITATLAPISAVIAIVFTILAGPQSGTGGEAKPQGPNTGQSGPSASIK